ncbi:hypothetical protein B0H11DRAFT_2230051 [Mycena galericulata]|nr:hypothetical protein B0H11DRAFT_2230051 [Mycena galericulata]
MIPTIPTSTSATATKKSAGGWRRRGLVDSAEVLSETWEITIVTWEIMITAIKLRAIVGGIALSDSDYAGDLDVLDLKPTPLMPDTGYSRPSHSAHVDCHPTQRQRIESLRRRARATSFLVNRKHIGYRALASARAQASSINARKRSLIRRAPAVSRAIDIDMPSVSRVDPQHIARHARSRVSLLYLGHPTHPPTAQERKQHKQA